MIRLRIDDKLKELDKTRYWLAKQSGIPSPTLYRYCRNFRRDSSGKLLQDKNGQLIYESKSIKLNHLGMLHNTLKTDPGNLIEIASDGTASIAIKTILASMGISMHRFSKSHHFNNTTLWKLATNQRGAIFLETLENLYRTLECRKSELIEIISGNSITE